MPDDPIDADLAALSHALGGLTPAAPALNRDRLLYEAGRRAGRGSDRRVWQVAAGLFAVLSAGLGTRLATVPVQPAHVLVVHDAGASRERERPEDSSPPVAHAPGSPATPRPTGAPYLHLRDQVVRFGADSLPALGSATQPRSPAVSPPVEQMLGLPPGTLDDAHKSRWNHQLFRGDV